MIIYAIIVTYNGAKWIDKCFGSLMNSSIPVKILAIDNASTDGTPAIVREKYPQVEVIETGLNLGFGKANNIGLKRALDENADYAFLLNQDAWVEEDTLEKLIFAQKAYPDFHLLSPIHLAGNGMTIDRNFQNYISSQFTPGFLSDLFLKKLKPIYEGKYANAAAWLLTRFCLETVGGFDPHFKQYGEDDDYILRLHKAGLKLGIVPDTKIFHDRPQNGQMNKSFYENRVYTRALLTNKQTNPPKKHFLLRKIITDYITLYVTYLGKDRNLRNVIRSNIKALKIRNKVFQNRDEQRKGRTFLN